MTQEEQSSSIGVGFAMGLLIGAAIGILYAPRSGRETREIIKEKAEVTKEKAEKVIEEAEKIIGEAKKKAETIIENAREKAAEMRHTRDNQAETPE